MKIDPNRTLIGQLGAMAVSQRSLRRLSMVSRIPRNSRVGNKSQERRLNGSYMQAVHTARTQEE
jgi:hypothetical protein